MISFISTFSVVTLSSSHLYVAEINLWLFPAVLPSISILSWHFESTTKIKTPHRYVVYSKKCFGKFKNCGQQRLKNSLLLVSVNLLPHWVTNASVKKWKDLRIAALSLLHSFLVTYPHLAVPFFHRWQLLHSFIHPY